MKKPTVAICYDFDMTLSPKNMQEFKFFDDLGFTPNEFWTKQNYFCEKNVSDRMLANMYSMVKEAKDKGICARIEEQIKKSKEREQVKIKQDKFKKIKNFDLSYISNMEDI